MKNILWVITIFFNLIQANAISINQVAGSPFAVGTAPIGVSYRPDDEFVAVSNTTTNNVSIFSVAPITGVLTSIGAAVAVGTNPTGVAYSPNSLFLATSNNASNNVSVFTVNQLTGALTPVAGSPFAAGTGPFSLAYSPNNLFLAVPNTTSNNVSVYTVNQLTGVLTPVAGSPFAAGTGARGVSFSPNNAFLAVGNVTSNNISVYTVNQLTGALTPVAGSPFAAGAGPQSVAYHPSGSFLAAANNGAASISVYTVNQTTGVLTQIAGSPFTTGTSPRGFAYSPDGYYLINVNSSNANIRIFAVNQITGALTQITGSPIAVGTDPRRVGFSSQGTFFTVSNLGNNNVRTFKLCYSELGSDTDVNRFEVQPFVCDQGRIAAFALLNAGFILNNASATAFFDSFFPVSGNIDLLEGTLELDKDLVLVNASQLNTIGTIIGNGHKLILSSNISVLPQVVPSGGCFGWQDLHLVLAGDLTLQECCITFVGSSVINGQGHSLTIDANSTIQIEANANLLCDNVTINGLQGSNIAPLDSTSTVSLQNTNWVLSNDFTFATGSLQVKPGTFTLSGLNNNFIYSSAQQSILDNNATFIVDNTIVNKNAVLDIFNVIPLVNRRGTLARISN